ncbi:MAG: arsenite transporter [Desulfuromonadaceae bacterium GWC2_58_13]|nr:MAG: arsenite transporter [Desulfuromonadaceae bacterium GWC2_58_13]
MWNFLGLLNKRLIVAIPTMMVVGFLYGAWLEAGWLKDLIIPFTFLMVYPMMVTLKIRKVFEGGDGKAQLLTQVVNFAVIPFVAYGFGQLFFADRPYLALGLLLAALVPTSGMTISWTGFAKGNLAAAVKMTVVGLVLGSLATPFYVQALLGAMVAIDMTKVFTQIGLIVFLPMAAGYATQQILVRRYGQQAFAERVAPRFPGLSTIGVLGIVFIAMALKAKAIAAAPQLLLVIFVPLLLLYLFNYLLSTLLGRMLLPRGDAIAMVYGTVMRNLSIALAVAINAFGPAGSDAALVISLAFVVQVQSAAWYVKFTDRVFGAAMVKTPVEVAG